jgi:hypothetical protein
MKHLKNYENIDSDIKVGDYVLVKSIFSTEKLNKFINNSIGQLTKIQDDYSIIKVRYTKIPFELKQFFDVIDQRYFGIENVVDYDKDIEVLKLKIAAKKYNI